MIQCCRFLTIFASDLKSETAEMSDLKPDEN